ncbi:YggT family protein [bacterium]|nr:YggT family protein [bacterium]
MKEYLALFIDIFGEIIILAILIRVIMSWIRPMGNKGGLGSFVFEITEPLLSFFRKIIPRMGMFDLSPIIALFAIEIVRSFLLSLLM